MKYITGSLPSFPVFSNKKCVLLCVDAAAAAAAVAVLERCRPGPTSVAQSEWPRLVAASTLHNSRTIRRTETAASGGSHRLVRRIRRVRTCCVLHQNPSSIRPIDDWQQLWDYRNIVAGPPSSSNIIRHFVLVDQCMVRKRRRASLIEDSTHHRLRRPRFDHGAVV